MAASNIRSALSVWLRQASKKNPTSASYALSLCESLHSTANMNREQTNSGGTSYDDNMELAEGAQKQDVHSGSIGGLARAACPLQRTTELSRDRKSGS